METKKINYTITFLSEWHAGSGLSSGAEADAVVIKDKNNLPYLPGKTIKGLLKDALMDMKEVQSDFNIEDLESLFGKINTDESTTAGTLFFSNVELPENEEKEISEEMSKHLYRIHASTKIEENGVAKNGSLRTMEVTIPLVLEGYISFENELSKNQHDLIEKATKWTRSLGANRNRGLGRCKIEIKAQL